MNDYFVCEWRSEVSSCASLLSIPSPVFLLWSDEKEGVGEHAVDACYQHVWPPVVPLRLYGGGK
jgi:hypothetical protein